MRILLVTPYYPPEPGACATRVSELARAWVDEGHEVHVLTGMPCYPDGVVKPGYRGKLVVHERRMGVQVHRSWVNAQPNATTAQRASYYGSFFAPVVLLGLTGVSEVDVIVATSPHIVAAVAGAVLAKLRGTPLVVEIRDVWPRVIWELGVWPKDSAVIKILEQVEVRLYRAAKRIVVVTDTFAQEVHDRVPDWPIEHISVVKNGVDLSRFRPDEDGAALRAELGIEPDAFVALYAGTHGQSQQLEQVVDAAVLAPGVQWVLVGQGQRKADLIKRGQGIDNLTFLPAVLPDRMPELYALADVCLVPLKDLAIFERTIPSKMFEIWAAGRPQVLGVRGEAARMLDASGAGLAVPPEDPRALAEAVSSLAADPALCAQMGASGRAYVAEHFDRRVLARNYLKVLKEAAFG